MTTDDAKSYLSKREIPRLFESLMTGLMYHRPQDHINYLIECLQKVHEKGQENISWSSFVDIRRSKTPLPPISANGRKHSSKGSRPSSKTRAKTPQGVDGYDMEVDKTDERVTSPPARGVGSDKDGNVSTFDNDTLDSVCLSKEEKNTPREIPVTSPLPAITSSENVNFSDTPVVLLIGAPGSGKQHQVNRLLLRYEGWVHFSIGDLLRTEIKEKGNAVSNWKMIQELLNRGEPAPEDVISSVLLTNLKKVSNAKGVIISGFPRSLEQVSEFGKVVGRVDVAFILDCEEQQATDRLLRKGKESRKPEDTLTAIANRMRLYKCNTLPAAKYFDDQGKLVVIDGDKGVQEVEWEFGRAFDNMFYSKSGCKKLEETMSPPASPLPAPSVYHKQFSKESDIPKDKPLFVGAIPQPPSNLAEDEGRKPDLPQCPIIFVAGGPGSGKGTQCERIIQRYPDFVHLSMGDILRTEISEKGSADEKWGMVATLLSKGEMAPEEVTIDLLKSCLKKHMDAKCIVIEGFPRDQDQIEKFNKFIGGLSFVILFDCEEYYMQTRLMKRGKESGRIDDNLGAIAKKIEFYKYHTLPIMKYYEDIGKLVVRNVADLDADRDMEEMFYEISKLFDFAFFAKPPSDNDGQATTTAN